MCVCECMIVPWLWETDTQNQQKHLNVATEKNGFICFVSFDNSLALCECVSVGVFVYRLDLEF